MEHKGKTSTGFEFTVDSNALNDMRMIDAIADTVGDNPIAFSNVCRLLLGEQQKKALYDHLEENGRVPVDKVGLAIKEIFELIGDEGKN